LPERQYNPSIRGLSVIAQRTVTTNPANPIFASPTLCFLA
jgi:hypothetical protein